MRNTVGEAHVGEPAVRVSEPWCGAMLTACVAAKLVIGSWAARNDIIRPRSKLRWTNCLTTGNVRGAERRVELSSLKFPETVCERQRLITLQRPIQRAGCRRLKKDQGE